jgi:FkbM family methyltransferase
MFENSRIGVGAGKRLKAAIRDACAPRILETPPSAVGSGRGSPLRKVRMTAGYTMLVDLRVAEQRDAWRTGLYEDVPLSLARRLVPAGGVFVDIGANIGFYTCSVGSEIAQSAGTVFAFEPVSSNRRRLRQNVRLNRLGRVVKVLPWALGAEPGKLVMRRVPIGEAANAVGENMLSESDRRHIDRDGWPGEEVTVVPMDEWSSSLPRCDVVKIDVEGADLLVLQGATKTIERFRPVVFAEFNPYWMKQIHQNLDDVRRFARRTGYRIERLFGDRFLPLGDSHTDADEDIPSYVLIPEKRAAELTEARGPVRAGRPGP